MNINSFFTKLFIKGVTSHSMALQISVNKDYTLAELFEMVGERVCGGHRPVAAAGAADGDGKIVLAFAYIRGDHVHRHAANARNEVLSLLVFHNVFPDLCIVSGKLF